MGLKVICLAIAIVIGLLITIDAVLPPAHAFRSFEAQCYDIPAGFPAKFCDVRSPATGQWYAVTLMPGEVGPITLH